VCISTGRLSDAAVLQLLIFVRLELMAAGAWYSAVVMTIPEIHSGTFFYRRWLIYRIWYTHML